VLTIWAGSEQLQVVLKSKISKYEGDVFQEDALLEEAMQTPVSFLSPQLSKPKPVQDNTSVGELLSTPCSL
jgi:hypothetical protein